MVENRAQKIGILGGTFDPIHVGHLIIAQAVMERAGLSRFLFVPASAPPHKSGACKEPEASFPHRLRMAELATADNDRFLVSDREGRRPGPSYTVQFLRELLEEEGEAELFFLVGADWISGLSTWKEIDALFELCRFLVVPRPGYPRDRILELASGFHPAQARKLEEGWVPAPEIGISSSQIREKLVAGLSVRYLVPPAVEAYIHEHGLYGAKRQRLSAT